MDDGTTNEDPSFLIESCPNTHTLTLAVTLPTAAISPKGILITPLEAVIADRTYVFPTKIDPRSIATSITQSVLTLKATAVLLDRKQVRPSQKVQSNQYWSVSDLLFMPFIQASRTYTCATCTHVLMDQTFTSVRTLPSTNWHELVECWACHESEIIMPTSGHVAVALVSAWVSPCTLVIHPDSLVPLNWDLKGYGHCPQCSSIVALQPKFTNTVHVFKSRILANVRNTPWSLPKIRAAALIAEILDLVNLNAAHKFAVFDLDNQRTCLFVGWVINWNCKVRIRSTVARRAVKILYCVSHSVFTPFSVNDLPNGMGSVVIPDAQIVLDMLHSVNRDLPLSQQYVCVQNESWNISYLSV